MKNKEQILYLKSGLVYTEFPKVIEAMVEYAKQYHAQQLILSGVSNRRELLIATLHGWQDYKDQGISIEDYVDEIESNL